MFLRQSDIIVVVICRVVQRLKQITGVVDTGLFIQLASKAYIGMSNGSVHIVEKS